MFEVEQVLPAPHSLVVAAVLGSHSWVAGDAHDGWHLAVVRSEITDAQHTCPLGQLDPSVHSRVAVSSFAGHGAMHW